MPVLLKKKSEAEQEEVQGTPETTVAEVAAKYAGLDGRREALAAKIKKLQAECKQLDLEMQPLDVVLRKYVEDRVTVPGVSMNPTFEYGPLHVEGYQVGLGKAPSSRAITDLKGIYDYLGHEKFMSLATIKLTDVDQYVPEPVRSQTVTKSYDEEKRPLHVTALKNKG
jgi:hypothetical protein